MTVNDAVTVCIKAFERPACLKRAVESVRDFYPDVKIMVADDSEKPAMLPGVTNYVLPFDTGLSFGRNRIIERVKTPFMFLMEDDAYFSEETDLESLRDAMRRTTFDILGVTLVEMPKKEAHPSGYHLYIRGDCGYFCPGNRGEQQGYPIYDYVPNVFMARSARLRWFKGWDEQFKICEHRDFFLRAKGRLLVGAMQSVAIMHEHIEDTRYRKFRRGSRVHHFWGLLCKKHRITHWHNNIQPHSPWEGDA